MKVILDAKMTSNMSHQRNNASLLPELLAEKYQIKSLGGSSGLKTCVQ